MFFYVFGFNYCSESLLLDYVLEILVDDVSYMFVEVYGGHNDGIF